MATPELIDISDVKTIRQRIFDSVRNAFLSTPAYTQGPWSIELTDVQYKDSEPEEELLSPFSHKKAIVTNATLARDLYGTIKITTPDGVIKKRTLLAKVPYLTDRGVFIINGVEYAITNQQRLKPGVYVRFRQTGEPEAFINLPGHKTHRYVLDPRTGIFYIQAGQATFRLYPILKAMGVTDEEIRNAWGADLFARNAVEKSDDLRRFATRMFGSPDVDISREFTQVPVAADVMRRNLGLIQNYLDKRAALASTVKMIQLLQGQAKEDDRDSIANQQFLGPEDIFADGVPMKMRLILRNILWKAMRNPKKEIIPPRPAQAIIDHVIRASGLMSAPAEINPVEILDHLFKVTRMGEGGIGATEAIPYSARDVHATQFGFIDPVTTPESLRVGVDTRFTVTAKRGADGLLYIPAVDVKTGKKTWLNSEQTEDVTIAFPGELETGRKFVRAIHKGSEAIVPRDQVTHYIKDATHIFGPLASLIPMKSACFPQRVAMGSRFITQALPLINREVPLVQSVDAEGTPFVAKFGQYAGAVKSPCKGVVRKVTPDFIEVYDSDAKKTRKIWIHNNTPYARQTALYNEPLVKPGDVIKPGQLLAYSNFTDQNGNLAMGVNAKIAYMATGDTYEDAFVISESFAKRLTAENLFVYEHKPSEGSGKPFYVSLFPNKLTSEALERYTEEGVAKPGTVLSKGDPIVLSVKMLPITTARASHRMFVDDSITWDYDSPGIVIAAGKTKDGYIAMVKSLFETQQGDKIAGQYGNKGVVIIKPDSQMPIGEDGKPVDIVSSPFIISRANIGQIYEALLGKVAKKLGRPIYVKDFENADKLHQYVTEMLKKHGVKDTEVLTDPATGRKIRALTGYGYILRLCHIAEDKLQAVDEAIASSVEDIPTVGETGKAKRLGLLELNALLAHGAYDTITDAALIRGQANEEAWRQFMTGYNLPQPKVPHIWHKFVALLRGAGINPIQERSGIRLLALRDKDIDTLAGKRYIQNSETVRVFSDGFRTVQGGLFDDGLTGGLAGTRWAAIKLPEPVPNPVMLELLGRLIGVSEKDFISMWAGEIPIPERYRTGKEPITGPQAVLNLFKNYNVSREIERTKEELQVAAPSKRASLIKKLNYLEGLKKFGIHPSELFWTKVPVTPPIFRPISMIKDGTLIVNDANYLYKELLDFISAYSEIAGELSQLTDERKTLINILRGLAGLDDPHNYALKRQGIKGLLATVVGPSPKAGIMQRKMLGISATLAGRAVITPNSSLDIDEIGLPEDAAWVAYKPFIIRDLMRRGLPDSVLRNVPPALRQSPFLVANLLVREKHPYARESLQRVIEQRPVVVNRAPVLHKYGIMAFKPVLTQGKTIEISPLITQAFGADFDGDTMQFHVPASDDAVKEAFTKLLPSKNLFKAATLTEPVYTPQQDYLIGLWYARRVDKNKPVKVFSTKQDALAAFARGEVAIDQPIKILES